ncbi:MAG: LVIVD repeat-containing protein [Promethearchaeota archaeon]
MRINKITLVTYIVVVFLLTSGLFCTLSRGQAIQRYSLTELGSVATNGEAVRVTVVDNIAYVLDTTDNAPEGVVLIDVSDPYNPEKLSSFYDGGFPSAISIVGDLAYVADRQDGLEILNVSDPYHPEKIAQFFAGGYTTDIEIVNDLAFLADWNNGLRILDISNPVAPVELSQYNAYWLCCVHVCVENNRAYITDHKNEYTGMRILDISDPSNPVFLGSYMPLFVDLWGPKVSDDLVIAANHHQDTGELQIFNVTDPTSIQLVGNFSDGGAVSNAQIIEDLVYIADYFDGVEIVDISDPANPIEIGQYFDGGHACEVYVENDLLYVADRDDGLEILKLEELPPETTVSTPGFTYEIVFLIAISLFLITKKKALKRWN